MKMYNFSKKRKAQLYTIIVTLLLCVSACAFSNFDTYASTQVTDYNVLNDYSISDYIMPFDANDEFEKFGCGEDTENAQWYLKALNKGVWPFTGYYQNPTDYPHFFVTSFTRKPVNDQITHIKFFQMPEDAFVLFLNSSYYVMIPNIPSDYRGYNFEMDNESDVFLTGTINDRRGDIKRFGDIPYQAIYVSSYNSSSEAPIINGDVPYYHMDVDYLVDVPSNNSAFDESDNGNGSSDYGGVGNVSNEQWENFTYLIGNSGFYMQSSNCSNGNLQVVAEYPNKLKEGENGITDASKYTLKITGTANYNLTVKSNLDLTTRGLLKGYGATGNPPFTSNINFTLDSGARALTTKIYERKLSDYGSTVQNIKLTTINNNMLCSTNKTAVDLAEMITDDSGSFWQGGIDYAVDQATGMSILGNHFGKIENWSSQKYDINDIVYSFTMTLYDENDNALGSKSATFDMRTGTKTDGADTLTVTDEEIYDNTSDSDYYNHTGDSAPTSNNYNGSGSSGTGSGTSVVTGDNNIVINNNPTNNVNGGSGGSGDTSESSLFGSFSITGTILNWIINGKDSGVDALEDMSGSTGWLNIVTSSYSFVPIEFWNVLITTFTVCCGIVIVAFIIAIVIKFVT